MFFPNRKIVLASASPRRAAILQQLGIAPIIYPVQVEELNELTPSRDAEALVAANAANKAKAAASQFADAIIIGADTAVVLDEQLFGKPADRAEAKLMLSALSGETHQVYTGICLIDSRTNKTVGGADSCEVIFQRLSEREIERYLDTDEPYDKAGAYAIQGQAAWFIKSISGDYYTVVGLSVPLLRQLQTIFNL